MSSVAKRYRDSIVRALDALVEDREGIFGMARDAVVAALAHDRLVYVAGSGHSHLIAAEVFYRAGGIAAAQAVFDTDLMLHVSATASTQAEREPGRADRLLERYDVQAGEVVFIVSNSGRNAFPVEMAIGAKARGAVTIALTSLQHSAQVTSRHPSGKRLFEVADIVLDNRVGYGDACLEIGQEGVAMGPTSTILGAFIINAVLADAVATLAEQGVAIDVYQSANGNGGETATDEIVGRWKSRIKGL